MKSFIIEHSVQDQINEDGQKLMKELRIAIDGIAQKYAEMGYSTLEIEALIISEASLVATFEFTAIKLKRFEKLNTNNNLKRIEELI